MGAPGVVRALALIPDGSSNGPSGPSTIVLSDYDRTLVALSSAQVEPVFQTTGSGANPKSDRHELGNFRNSAALNPNP